jgi:hypothetical protein
MKILSFFFLIVVNMLISISYATEDLNSYYEISKLFNERAERIACEFLNTEIIRIKDLNDDEIREEFEIANKHLQVEMTKTEDLQGNTEYKMISNQINKLLKVDSLKQKILHVIEGLCQASSIPMRIGTRGFSLGNSALIHSAAFPILGLFNIIDGFFSRRKSKLNERNDFLIRAFGPKTNISRIFLSIISSEMGQLIIGNSPGLRVVNASILLEMINNFQCFNGHNFDTNLVSFCKTYGDLRDFFHKGHEKIFKIGKRFQYLVDQKIIQTKRNISPAEVCTYLPRKQVRIAKRVLQRYPHILEDSRISDVNIIPPIHKNSCTKILFFGKTAKDVESLEKEHKFLEGIEVVIILKNSFPRTLLYTAEELRSLTPEDAYCYEAESVYYRNLVQDEFRVYSDLLKSAYAPSLLAHPTISEIKIDDKLLRKSHLSNLRNIIFTVGPSEEEELEARDLMEEKKKLLFEIKKNYRKTMNSGSFGSCKKIFQDLNINGNEFTEKIKRITELDNDKVLKKTNEFQLLEKLFKKEEKRLHLKWELVRTNDLDQVFNSLKSTNFGHVIIVAHGRKSGHLIDNLGQEYPREVFTQISPTIQSINFYSCYSKKIVNLYQIKENLENIPGYYKIRYVSTVAENEFMDGTNLAPISAFGYYLNQVDRFLARSKRGALFLQTMFGHQLLPMEQNDICNLNASEIKILNGSYALILNDKFVGTIGNNRASFLEYPCYFLLKDQPNQLRIKSISVDGHSVIGNLDKLSILINDQPIFPYLAFNNLIIFKFTP